MTVAFSNSRPALPHCLQQLVENSPERMACFGPDRCYWAVSDALVTALEVSSDKLLGFTNGDLVSHTEPTNYPQAWRKYWRQVEDAIATSCTRARPSAAFTPYLPLTGCNCMKPPIPPYSIPRDR
ncbi:MAG: hypothetical protein HC812_12995 [Leptolyngbya sp. RL_3_1]|nr:hypothetical protein [Leptolyngbya sp. RL_3_1]